ncbi:hypothetical protein FQR65_LT12988 [Abscondita terminalis]|nr:hypothetical protein FQR65_LT12988 [Abscondita terminalis]
MIILTLRLLILGNLLRIILCISGGENATIGQFPHQVSLQLQIGIKRVHVCGGSIISPNWILTSAFCLDSHMVDACKIDVLVNTISVNIGGQRYEIAEFYKHDEFDRDTLMHDIALIRLKNNILFCNGVNAVELAAKEPADGSVCQLSGWGYPSVTNETVPNLQHANTTKIPCRPYKMSYSLNDRNLCSFSNSIRVYVGDYGSPLLFDKMQVGVVSWELFFEGNRTEIVVYTSVAKYRDWIQERISKNDGPICNCTTNNTINTSQTSSTVLIIVIFILVLVTVNLCLTSWNSRQIKRIVKSDRRTLQSGSIEW